MILNQFIKHLFTLMNNTLPSLKRLLNWQFLFLFLHWLAIRKTSNLTIKVWRSRSYLSMTNLIEPLHRSSSTAGYEQGRWRQSTPSAVRRRPVWLYCRTPPSSKTVTGWPKQGTGSVRTKLLIPLLLALIDKKDCVNANIHFIFCLIWFTRRFNLLKNVE